MSSVGSWQIDLLNSRTLEEKVGDFISCLDYGASVSGSAAANTIAINSAITAAALSGASGFVVIPPGISYTEASLVIPDEVVLLVFSSSGIVTVLTKDQGTAYPITKGGLAIKSQGHNGILLRSSDYGVTAEPLFEVVDLTNGDPAGIEISMGQFVSLGDNTDPSAPAAGKARLYLTYDTGSSKYQLRILFPSGSAQTVVAQA